ncbi:unnamed protein product [Musa acuminata subsp. malaccensis]|uniref:(wild Malaysian banana) hypothetical protein n=1 Tax=Musa acuminata subsp. malaccensis TaxID=214687 RepID=A0A804JY27_MUSAM|nr:unnamed protein product [Musa acuminata subsp. malaccensis]
MADTSNASRACNRSSKSKRQGQRNAKNSLSWGFLETLAFVYTHLNLLFSAVISDLGPEDTSRTIIEIIFQSSWLENQSPVCKIDRILKVHNTQKAVTSSECCGVIGGKVVATDVESACSFCFLPLCFRTKRKFICTLCRRRLVSHRASSTATTFYA